MDPARRTDWKTEAMPAATESLDVEQTYTHEEFARLCFGVVPSSMDERWFVFFEAPWLYAHRSWTGYCIYQIRFERTEAGAKISEAISNRDSAQYGEMDASSDASRLRYLLDTVIEHNSGHRYVPSFTDRTT